MSDVIDFKGLFPIVEQADRVPAARSRVVERAFIQELVLFALPVLRAICGVFTVFAASWVSTWTYHEIFLNGAIVRDQHLAIGLAGGLIYAAIAHARGLDNLERRPTLGASLHAAGSIWIGVFIMLMVIVVLLKAGDALSRGSLIVFFMVSLVTVTLLDWGWPTLIERLKRANVLPSTRVAVLVIGSNETFADATRYLKSSGRHLTHAWRSKALRTKADAAAAARSILVGLQSQPFTELLISAPVSQMRQVEAISEALRLAPLRVYLQLDGKLKWVAGKPIETNDDRVIVELSREPLGMFERLLKRSFDIAAASAALFALAPVLALVALAIRLDSPGPILFRQRRDGFGGQPFRIYKFRSMRVMEDGAHIPQARVGDERITRVGQFIRRTSLDELPQLLNVLAGDMSLVGPRPHAIAHGQYYSRLIGDYAHRHHVKPGLTGWAQMNGCRGETRSVEQMRDRVTHDLWYIDNWSFWLDMRIILMTVRQVIVNRDAV